METKTPRYRVEINYPKFRKPTYFLVKDVKVKGKKVKVKKYICSGEHPSAEEVQKFRERYTYDIEIRAARKKAEISSSFYPHKYLTLGTLRKLEELRYIYQANRDLLTTDELKVYEDNFEIHYIQGTTSIEGNTLSLRETEDLLLYGIPPKEKSLREINEVQNFKNVVAYRNNYKGKITVEFIKHLHRLIMNNISSSAGAFRRLDDICISGCDIRPTPSIQIEEELSEIINNYYENLEKESYPFEEAAIFHYNFESIHPFTDGNGRVGREVFNYMLIREKFPKLLFLGKNRETYIQALRLGNQDKYSEMVSVFADLIIEQRLNILGENLRKIVIPIRKPGQTSLFDF